MVVTTMSLSTRALDLKYKFLRIILIVGFTPAINQFYMLSCHLLLGLPAFLLVSGRLFLVSFSSQLWSILDIWLFQFRIRYVIHSGTPVIWQRFLIFSFLIVSYLVFSVILCRTSISVTCDCVLIFKLSGHVSARYVRMGLNALLYILTFSSVPKYLLFQITSFTKTC